MCVEYFEGFGVDSSSSDYRALGVWVHHILQIPRVDVNMHFCNVWSEDGPSKVGKSLTLLWVTHKIS